MGRDRFSLSCPIFRNGTLQCELPSAAPVGGGIEHASARHDGQTRHFDHRQARARYDPTVSWVSTGKFQYAKVRCSIKIACNIITDEVCDREITHRTRAPIEVRPRRVGSRGVVRNFEYMPRGSWG